MTACTSTCFFFFFNDTATTEIYTLSLHDALPISDHEQEMPSCILYSDPSIPDRTEAILKGAEGEMIDALEDRKSTRLNSSHANISYAVFCLKKKKKYNLALTDMTIQNKTIFNTQS